MQVSRIPFRTVSPSSYANRPSVKEALFAFPSQRTSGRLDNLSSCNMISKSTGWFPASDASEVVVEEQVIPEIDKVSWWWKRGFCAGTNDHGLLNSGGCLNFGGCCFFLGVVFCLSSHGDVLWDPGLGKLGTSKLSQPPMFSLEQLV